MAHSQKPHPPHPSPPPPLPPSPPPPVPPPPTPVPVISFVPPNPSIPPTTPLGTKIAVIVVTMSDGSPFTGGVVFGPPNYDDGGVFIISGNDLILNPNGPGLPETNSIEHCTVMTTP